MYILVIIVYVSANEKFVGYVVSIGKMDCIEKVLFFKLS